MPTPARQFLAGDLTEVPVFDRALGLDEADAIEQYLTRKWGLR